MHGGSIYNLLEGAFDRALSLLFVGNSIFWRCFQRPLLAGFLHVLHCCARDTRDSLRVADVQPPRAVSHRNTV